MWKSNLPEVNQLTNTQPVAFQNGYINLGPYQVISYQFPGQLEGTPADFTLADAQLAQDLQLNSANAAKVWRLDNDLTWHHVEDGETLQLVPTGIK